MAARIYVATVEEALARLPADHFGACLSDPPYGLDFMPSRTDGWDQQVPSVDVFRQLLRVLRPGAFAFVFGHPRLFHRLMINAEDAGFRLRDTVAWFYGSGYPKSKNEGPLGTALKPAWEPVVLMQKPHPNETVAEARAYLDIDAGRVATDWSERPESWKRSGHSAQPDADKIAAPPGQGIECNPLGRWPANVVLDESAGAELDAQAGTLKPSTVRTATRSTMGYKGSNAVEKVKVSLSFGDAGGASRFFFCAKASSEERDEGLEAFPILGAEETVDRDPERPGAKNPRAGAGRNGNRRNGHPTVKPIALNRWLAGMLRGANTGAPLLVPYAGVGSEMIGASAAGWSEIVGIEKDPRYVAMACARMAARAYPCEPDRPIGELFAIKGAGQIPLFGAKAS